MTDLTRYSLFAQKVQIDPKTKQPAERNIPGETLLDFFIPGEKLYLAQNDDFTTQAEIISNAPAGTQLILVDRDDLIYGSPEAAQKLKEVLPIDYLAGAYSSIFKGGCEPLKADRPLKIVVVDFANGYDSGNANIPPEISRQFVHDSCGAIDKNLLKELTDKDKAIQFRMGVKSAKQTTFAKGFLNTIDLPQLFPAGDAPDMILSLDSFKGQKPVPGMYEYQPEELFFGIKNDSQNTKSAISEVLSIYPQAAHDVLPVVQAEAQVLAAHSQNLVLAAAWALNDYYMENEAQPDEFNTINLMDMALSTGRYDLLNSVQVKDWLGDRLSASWRNLSFADTRRLNGNNATVLPAWDLKYGEIAVPWLKDDEEFVFFRSPVVNRNGLLTVKNNLKAWESLQKLGADPDIMYVNIQTLERIEAEDPDTYDALIEEYGTEERLKAEFQTLMQSTQMDYDGDTGNAISRTIVPNLYAAVQENEHPDAKLPNFEKRAKNLPTEMTLPEVAVHIRPPYVNLVYSQKARLHLSKSEIDLAIESGDAELIDRLAIEYLEKTNQSLFAAVKDRFTGMGIDGEFHPVTLPSSIKDAAQVFSDSFDEKWAIEAYESAGYHRSLFKMIDFQKSLARFRDDCERLEFTTPDGKVKNKLPEKLLTAIDDFNRVYLPNFIKKYPERAGELQEVVDRYQNLSRSIEQGIDTSIPLKFTETRERFDPLTKHFIKYEDTESVKLTRLAADPELSNIDRLRSYQDILDEAIVVTSQLNQDAVDIFKSANQIEVELSSAIATNFSRDKYTSVSGKSKSAAYNNNFKPKPTGFSLPETLQDLCNQNYQQLVGVASRNENREPTSTNANLTGAFKDISVSEQALAIAGFYINDDQEAIDKYTEYNRIAKLAGKERTYLEIKYAGIKIDIFGLDKSGINALKNDKFGEFKLNLLDGNATYIELDINGKFVTEHDVGSLDREWCKNFAQKCGEDTIEFEAIDFQTGVAKGLIDFVKVGDTKAAIQRERKAAVVNMRQAFEKAEIGQMESLAAIAKVTGNANPALLLATYPQSLIERIKVTVDESLILDKSAAELLESLGTQQFKFNVDDKGALNPTAPDGNSYKIEFASNIHRQAYRQSGNFADKAKAAMYSALPAGLLGEGRLQKETVNLSIELSNKKRILAVNLTPTGKSVESAQNLTLEKVTSTPYQIDIKGLKCAVVYTSDGLGELIDRSIGDDAVGNLQFSEFRVNPRSLANQKPTFSAVLEDNGREYYLTGIMPDSDAAGEPIDYSKVLSGYVAFNNIDRQIIKADPVTIGYELYQNIDGNRHKLGDITARSAITAQLTGDEQISTISPNHHYRLDIPDPQKVMNAAVWKIQSESKLYEPTVYQREPSETDTQNANIRSQILNRLSSNSILMTEIKQPVIKNDGVDLKNFYQINLPVSAASEMKEYLNKQKIPYQSYLDTHPAYIEEYRRGYEVLVVDPVELEQKKGSKVDKLDRFISKFGKPLEPDGYQQALSDARVVRPVIGQDLRKLGDWLSQADLVNTELPAIDVDKLGSVPLFLKGIQAEVRSRFGARMGVTEDGKHAVFSFGVDYLRQQLNHALGDTLTNVEYTSEQRQRPVYAAVIPTAELESYVREHYHQLSYNFDRETGSTINPVLKTFNVDRLDKLPARAAIDVAMGFSANKFIGKSLAEATTRTDLYVEAYGRAANSPSYTAEDVVMVTGNRFINKQIGREVMGKFFQAEYLPLLKSARKAGATIVVGNGNSIDALTKQYLSDSGYAILDHPSGYAEAVPQGRAVERQQQLKQTIEVTPAPVGVIEPEAKKKRTTKARSSETSKTAKSAKSNLASKIDKVDKTQSQIASTENKSSLANDSNAVLSDREVTEIIAEPTLKVEQTKKTLKSLCEPLEAAKLDDYVPSGKQEALAT
jgi:hypothetical protein